LSWQIKLGSWVLAGSRVPKGPTEPNKEDGAQLSHLRPSLRTNALLMALAMLVLPQLIVVGWSFMERDIGGKLQWETKISVEEATRALAAGASREKTAAALDEIARRWGTRVRVVGDDGEVRFDADADRGTDLVHQVGTLFFGPDGAPTLREFDETLGAVVKRAEVVKVTGWSTRDPPPSEPGIETGCRTSPAGKLLVCHAACGVEIDGRSHVIYAQESSRRAVRALYDLRYHLARLSIVMLPFALVFSWWMGRRMVRPIEWLRARVLEKARSANPRADIDLRGGDEVRDLAVAFNDLLGALDERRQANEAFVADLVHEFKNPVAAIRACAESLATGSADEKRAARLAKILSDSSGRLDALVSQFLELARAEAGMPREDRSDVDVGALASGVVSAIEPAFEDVRFVVEPEPDTLVVGVAPRLDSLVRNLVDNAASFAGKGGEVRIVVKREAPSSHGAASVVAIEVSDSGPGIAEADLPRVFERFFTTRALARPDADRPIPRKRGSGLGLALVKAVAEAHGGSVSARSTLGEGATFRVTLPAK
jgi:signal transduction histidine kinase